MDILNSLITKPELRGDEIFRDRLLDILNQGYPDQVLYVSAGPGFGKSVLVNQWIEQEKIRHVWVSCDPILNDPGLLAYYVLCALDKISPKDLSERTELFKQSFDDNSELYLSSFINALEEIETNTTLVFDDFHLLKDPLILDLFTRITDNSPKNVSLCLITRKDHLPNLDRLRARKLLCEIRGSVLNLNRTEILNTNIVQQVKPSRKDIQNILQLTEGWALGVSQCLYLLKNNRFGSEDSTQIKLSTLDRIFLREVIDNSSEFLQNALKFTSLFDRFCEPFLRDVIPNPEGRSRSQNYIQELKSNNLFLVQLDPEGTWYRFHHLFKQSLSDFLQGALEERDRIASLKRGSEWLITNGYYEDGIAIALQTPGADFAVGQLMKVKYKLLNTDQYLRLQRLLSLFPLTLQMSSPELLITRAILLENNAKHHALFQLLNQFEAEGFSTNEDDQTRAEFLIFQGMMCYFTGNFETALQTLDKGISLNKPEAESILTFANAYKAFTLNALDRYKEATTFLDAHLDSLLPNQVQSIVRTYDAMALLFSIRSELFALEPVAKKILDISKVHSFYESQGFAYYFLADIYYRQYRFESLPAIFKEVYEKRHLIRPVWFLKLWAIKAFYCLRVGAQRDLERTIKDLKRYVDERNAANLQNLSKALFLEIELQKGNPGRIGRSSANIDFDMYPPMFYHFLPQNTQLKLLLEGGDALSQHPFEEKLSNLENYATRIGHVGALTRIHILKALSWYRKGRSELARNQLCTAFSYSEPINDFMTYSEYGLDLYLLVKEMAKGRKDSVFVTKLAKILANLFAGGTKKSFKKPLELNFSDRDVQLLKLVSEGYSNEEIAERMYLSLNSVKKYLSQIYTQLDVKNRTSAILKAKDSGLL